MQDEYIEKINNLLVQTTDIELLDFICQILKKSIESSTSQEMPATFALHL